MKKLNKSNAADIEDGGIWEKNSKAKIISRRTLTGEEQERLEEKAGLEMISLRLPVDTIKKFKTMAEKEGITPEEVIARWESQIAMRRLGKPEEVAALVAFLASERAGFITGDTIQIDGGYYKGVM